ncbi:MAG: acetylxylan esterase [Vicinamibacteria bacterium]
MLKTFCKRAPLAIVAGSILGFTAVSATPQTPAATLTRPASLAKAPNVDGFIQRWLLLEPMPATGLTDSAVQSLVKREPFVNQLSVAPRDGDRQTVDGTELIWHAMDTTKYNVNLFHFARALGKKTSDVVFWAATIIDSPREIHDVRLAIGSNAASVWWVNGVEVIGIYGDRQAVIDDGVSKRLTLRKGQNVIRAAIVNGGGATDFCARFLDAADRPLKELTVNLGAAPTASSPVESRKQPMEVKQESKP